MQKLAVAIGAPRQVPLSNRTRRPGALASATGHNRPAPPTRFLIGNLTSVDSE